MSGAQIIDGKKIAADVRAEVAQGPQHALARAVGALHEEDANALEPKTGAHDI